MLHPTGLFNQLGRSLSRECLNFRLGLRLQPQTKLAIKFLSLQITCFPKLVFTYSRLINYNDTHQLGINIPTGILDSTIELTLQILTNLAISPSINQLTELTTGSQINLINYLQTHPIWSIITNWESLHRSDFTNLIICPLRITHSNFYKCTNVKCQIYKDYNLKT